MRYRAVVATRNPDAFDYAFTEQGLERLAGEAVGRPVSMLFTEAVGVVVEAERVKGQARITFETARDLVGAERLYCVPAFLDGTLYTFGLVPVPADSSLAPVEVAE